MQHLVKLAALLRVHQECLPRLARCLEGRFCASFIAEVRPHCDDVFRRPASGVLVGACRGTRRVPASTAVPDSPSGNRQMLRLLNQAAHAAVNQQYLRTVYMRFIGRRPTRRDRRDFASTLSSVVNILHDRVTYEERGPVSARLGPSSSCTILRELRTGTTSNSAWRLRGMLVTEPYPIFDPV